MWWHTCNPSTGEGTTEDQKFRILACELSEQVKTTKPDNQNPISRIDMVERIIL